MWLIRVYKVKSGFEGFSYEFTSVGIIEILYLAISKSLFGYK